MCDVAKLEKRIEEAPLDEFERSLVGELLREPDVRRLAQYMVLHSCSNARGFKTVNHALIGIAVAVGIAVVVAAVSLLVPTTHIQNAHAATTHGNASVSGSANSTPNVPVNINTEVKP